MKVNKDDYVEVKADSARCVDERGDKEGENLGWQAPGAGLHVVDLLRLAIFKAGAEVAEDKLWVMARGVFESEAAKSNKIMPGVHNDDEHGHLAMEECRQRNKGCGYDGVRVQVLGRFGLEMDGYVTGEHIDKALDMGWGLQTLTGDHMADATAAVNYMKGKTLKTKTLLRKGRTASFNYDIWVVDVLKGEMLKVLEEESFAEAAEVLRGKAMEWGKKLYVDTLDILSKGRLGEPSLIEIK